MWDHDSNTANHITQNSSQYPSGTRGMRFSREIIQFAASATFRKLLLRSKLLGAADFLEKNEMLRIHCLVDAGLTGHMRLYACAGSTYVSGVDLTPPIPATAKEWQAPTSILPIKMDRPQENGHVTNSQLGNVCCFEEVGSAAVQTSRQLLDGRVNLLRWNC